MLIALVGPESTGKTTLATALAEHLSSPILEEYAREYLELRSLSATYTQHDVLMIAKRQWEREQQAVLKKRQNLVMDTDLLVIKIWWEVKYGECHPWILDKLAKQRRRNYLLTATDMPWHADPLRENPEDRDELFKVYENELKANGSNYVIIRGNPEQRLAQAVTWISEMPK
ncbi:MAG: ATP-binding protein [Pseudomonadales bacterium]|nr:ATP-binding protein [Pseudomonadales bacterium]